MKARCDSLTDPIPNEKNTEETRPSSCSYGGFRRRLDYDVIEKKRDGTNLPVRRRVFFGVLISMLALVMAIAVGVILTSMDSLNVGTKKSARRTEALKSADVPHIWWDNAA